MPWITKNSVSVRSTGYDADREQPSVITEITDSGSYYFYLAQNEVVKYGSVIGTVVAEQYPTPLPPFTFPLPRLGNVYVLYMDSAGKFWVCEQAQLATLSIDSNIYYPMYRETQNSWVRWLPISVLADSATVRGSAGAKGSSSILIRLTALGSAGAKASNNANMILDLLTAMAGATGTVRVRTSDIAIESGGAFGSVISTIMGKGTYGSGAKGKVTVSVMASEQGEAGASGLLSLSQELRSGRAGASGIVQPTALVGLVLLSGNANLAGSTDAPTDSQFHMYGTNATPNLTYPEPDASNAAKSGNTYVKHVAYSYIQPAYSGYSPLLGLNRGSRVATNGVGDVLFISDDGTLRHLNPPDNVAGAVQVTIAEPSSITGVNYHHAINVSYNRTTGQWHLLYESVKYDTSFGLDLTNVLDRAVFTLIYDESVHGAINPASGSNWTIDRTLQSHMYLQPGVMIGLGIPSFQLTPGVGGTGNGVMSGFTLISDFSVFDGASTIAVTHPQVLDFSSYLTGVPNDTITFDVMVDGSGICNINGAGTFIGHATVTGHNGEIPGKWGGTVYPYSSNFYPVVDNDPLNPAITSSGGFAVWEPWIYDNPPLPVFNTTPWYILVGNSFYIYDCQSPLDSVVSGNSENWPVGHGTAGTANFPPGSKGFLNAQYVSVGAPLQQPSVTPFRTDDIAGASSLATALPPSLAGPHKFWTTVTISIIATVRWFDIHGNQTQQSARYIVYREQGGVNVVANTWLGVSDGGTYDDTPVDGGIGFLLSVSGGVSTNYSESVNGVWWGIGEDGSVVGYPQGERTPPTYYGPGGDHSILPAASLVLDQAPGFGADTVIYKDYSFGTGATSPFIDAVGNVIDNTGSLDSSMSGPARAITWDGSTGVYAIVGGDFVQRPGAFGTAWTTVVSGFSLETSILLLRYMEDGTILLVEGTAGRVRSSLWDGTRIIRGAYISFDTDNLFLISTRSGNPFSAFSLATII